MKYVQSTASFFIFLFIVLIPLNASAEMGDKAIQKWPKLFKRIQIINSRLVNLEAIEIKDLKDSLLETWEISSIHYIKQNKQKKH